MRILKYIFLLLVLIFIGVAVFIATQKGEYEIVRSRVIKTPRSIVFNYVNDYGNWQQWITWDDAATTFVYSNLTSGTGATMNWEGSASDGKMQTVFTKEGDSISQLMEVDGVDSDVSWKFKDTVGGTKVTWRIKGKMGFMPKIYAALQGGPQKVIGETYENSLVALDKTISHEIATYKIKVDGIVQMPGKFYLYQSITSTIANMPKNMRIMLFKLQYFFEKNKITTAGRPFISYDYFDRDKGVTRFSVCIPVPEEIFITPGSDIMSGKYNPFRAVKTTLTGDYSHQEEAWEKAYEYIGKNNLTESDGGEYLEIYRTGKDQIRLPSKWVTEIYIPITDQDIILAPAATLPKPVTPKPVEEEISTPN